MLASTAASAQGLFIDKPMQDGTRHIASYYEYIHQNGFDAHPVGFGIHAITLDGNVQAYALGVKYASAINMQIPEGSLLLLKCPDGTVIEGKQHLDAVDTDDHMLVDAFAGTRYFITGRYTISYDDLQKLCKDGIVKLRIECEGNPINREYSTRKAKKIAKHFTRSFNAIKAAIKSPKDIRDGF